MVKLKIIPSLPACKKSAQLINLFLSWDKQILESQDLEGQNHIWPGAYPK